MSEQMEMPIRRARVALAEDTEALPKEAGGGKARRGRIRLVQREPLNYPDEAAVGYSDWFLNARPPCLGWWDTCVNGTDEHQRLWFVPSDDPICDGGMWYERRAEGGLKFVGTHAEIGRQLQWRGLRAPYPEGYAWVVPGAEAFLALSRKRFREVLE
jgi:hypothetical protein